MQDSSKASPRTIFKGKNLIKHSKVLLEWIKERKGWMPTCANMCHAVPTCGNIAVCQLCRKRQSFFQTAALLSTQLIYSGWPAQSICIYQCFLLWWSKQRPRFANGQHYFQRKELERTTKANAQVTSGRGWVCWVQWANMRLPLCQRCTEDQAFSGQHPCFHESDFWRFTYWNFSTETSKGRHQCFLVVA